MHWLWHCATIAFLSRCINSRIYHIGLVLVHIYHLWFTMNLGVGVYSTSIALSFRVFSRNLRLSCFFTFLTSIEIIIYQIIFDHCYPWIGERRLTLKLPRWFKRNNNEGTKSCWTSINSNVASLRRTCTMSGLRYWKIPWLCYLPNHILMLRHPEHFLFILI
jgi:hypothetical protein